MKDDGDDGYLPFDDGWEDDADDADDLSGMFHADDPHTSVEAAAAVARKRTELHARVLQAFSEHGRMTDEDLELLPEFRDFGPSTIRKRRSELYQQGALEAVGDRVNSRHRKMLVWAIK
jgi:hypothetical protein